MPAKTADICDEHADSVRVLTPMFQDYGGRVEFSGPVSTVKLFEDNSRVREAVSEPGEGRVLVVDGGGSLRCALLGDNLAAMAVANGWQGIVVYGCIRDAAEIAAMDLGVKALNTHPCKSVKRGLGERDVPVTFAGETLRPGDYLYADRDGVVLASSALE